MEEERIIAHRLVIMHRLLIKLMGQAIVIIPCPCGRKYQGQACEADASEEERANGFFVTVS